MPRSASLLAATAIAVAALLALAAFKAPDAAPHSGAAICKTFCGIVIF